MDNNCNCDDYERIKKRIEDEQKKYKFCYIQELELENYNWLINDPLGNNGIKAYLFDSSLDMLNRTLDKYSQVLGFRIEFNIDLGTAGRGCPPSGTTPPARAANSCRARRRSPSRPCVWRRGRSVRAKCP